MPIQKAAFKHLLLLICLTMSHGIFAKVAYIPMFEATAQQENHIWAIDLESGHVLKRVFVGDCVGPIFINSVGDQLYAAASLENKIVLIDTLTLEVSHTWTNLPISPQQIILNTDESKLYFAERGRDDIYEIDLNTGTVNLALTINHFTDFYYSNNLQFIVFRSHDTVNDTYQLTTHYLNDLSFKYQADVTDKRPQLIDNTGENFYISLFGYGKFQSRSLNDGHLNWEFYHSSGRPGPFGPLPEYFSSAFQLNNNQILLTGWTGGSYEVNLSSGTGNRINQLTYVDGSYQHIEGSLFLKSNQPSAVICPPISPIPCSGYYPLTLVTQDHATNQEQVVFSRPNSGNLARGRYIGNKFYAIPVVPFLSHWLISVMLCVLVLVFALFKSKTGNDRLIKHSLR